MARGELDVGQIARLARVVNLGDVFRADVVVKEVVEEVADDCYVGLRVGRRGEVEGLGQTRGSKSVS